MNAMPPAVGYVGVDLILGADPGGRDDVILEVNPRLTTSYVGLRRLCRDNLAGAMLAIARGGAVQLSWQDAAIRFQADGQYLEMPG